jgi:hypothetical protein
MREKPQPELLRGLPWYTRLAIMPGVERRIKCRPGKQRLVLFGVARAT